MVIAMGRNIFMPIGENINIVERNIFNISAVVLLGLEILESIIDKVSLRNRD